MHTAEILRKINNLISIGTVTESKSEQGLSLARVKILERVTDFLPVAQSSNSFKTKASPVRVGEQVLVFSPYGEGDSGIIFGAIFNKGQKEPVGANDTTEITEYEDGTRISYDSEVKELKIQAAGKVTIICATATITADAVEVTSGSAKVTADAVTVDSASIDLGIGGTGVVTGESICPFTGSPHSDVSTNTRSKK